MTQPSLFVSNEATHIYVSLLEYTHVHTDKSIVVKNYVLLELAFALRKQTNKHEHTKGVSYRLSNIPDIPFTP
jgi:hypothetical protein